jgi:small subunit ribosomal protein S6e
MPEVKVVINDTKSGKSYQKVVPENEAQSLVGLKIGSKLSGDKLGLDGYELEIRGGSDNAGFPMRFDIDGFGRKKPYVSQGPGVRGLKKGQKTRKTVIGNTLSNTLHQINMKVIKYGSRSIEDCLGIKPKENTEEAKKEEAK